MNKDVRFFTEEKKGKPCWYRRIKKGRKKKKGRKFLSSKFPNN